MKKILIIEDEAVLGDVLLQKLQVSGYQAELIREGEKGFAKISEWMPDLILLDIFLPHLNGIEILKKKAADIKISGIPTIVLTNSYHPINGTEIEKFGVIDFLVKSNTTPEKIIERIKKVFENTPVTTIKASVDSTENVLSGKNILLVEDDGFLGSIMHSRLTNIKALVTVAKSGEEALEELKKQKFDAALLDILLPGITGFDVLQSIRDNPETKDMPATVISNFNQVKDKEKAESMGAAFLVKALVNPDDIVEHVGKMLSGKHI